MLFGVVDNQIWRIRLIWSQLNLTPQKVPCR